MNQDNTAIESPLRLWDAPETEEYVLSVILHNKQALVKAMSTLYSQRDFKNGMNAQAFAVIENRFDAGKDIDPVVVCDQWIDLGIYQTGQAQAVVGAWSGDSDYEPKIRELAVHGGMRKAKKDIGSLFEQASSDTTPEELSKKAFDMAVSWNSGFTKKYYKASEVSPEQQGERLGLGIPLLDETIYKNAGLCKGTVKGVIFREKHGKTRSACWEASQHLRQGRKVLYVTGEGQNIDIKGNFQQVLGPDFARYQDNLFLKDSAVDIAEIEATIIEAVFAEEVDVVVVDYLQLLELDVNRWVSENEKYNAICKRLRQMAVKYDFLLNLLSQATSQEKSDKGWYNVPQVYDAYGSKEIIKAASLIVIGFRPGLYDELLDRDMFDRKMKVKGPNEDLVPRTSVFLKAVRSRNKIECLHQWAHFIDTDEGFKIHRQELL